MNYKWSLMVGLALIMVLVGCSGLKSEEKVIESVEDIAKTTFQEDDIKSNTDLDSFSLYLPSGFKIEEESNTNIILQEKDQTYILFYNPLESNKSMLNYQDAMEEKDNNYLLLKSIKDDNRFGYIKVEISENNNYELQVGVGGVKITTITSKSNLEDATREMMKMANSIAYSSHT